MLGKIKKQQLTIFTCRDFQSDRSGKRNCVATGQLYPCECVDRLCDLLKTGDVVKVDLDACTVTAENGGKIYNFKPLGDVRPVVDAGGLFNYARKTGMIPK